MSDLVLVFADQLSHSLSALRNADKSSDTVLMMEVSDEANTVPHHRRKLAFLFSAMRHFAEELKNDGWQVRYIKLDASENLGSFESEILRSYNELGPERILVTEAGEWRVEEMLRTLRDEHDLPIKMLRDARFIATRMEFGQWAEDRLQMRMDFFYREMRRATGLLMDGDKPEGGKWNFDAENRTPPKSGMAFPDRFSVEPDQITKDVIELVQDRFPDRFGSLDNFSYAVTTHDAEQAVEEFMETCLPSFGTFQDAMLEGNSFLYHSVIALYINCGLLDPLEVCRKAEAAWRANKAPLNAVEGFIRQIIGWREYVRGIYWLKMPGYENSNALDAHEDLPPVYWGAETKMNCMAEAIRHTEQHAYSHHIQRLMITGNFALLTGINPHQMHEWYLSVYADAFEWVEMPNTIGMALFADDGLLASKPYAASANYINKMSNFCKNCSYNPKQRTGEDACPFNALYWNFLDRNREKFAGNHRMGMMMKNLDRIDADELKEITKRAQWIKEKMQTGTL